MHASIFMNELHIVFNAQFYTLFSNETYVQMGQKHRGGL